MAVLKKYELCTEEIWGRYMKLYALEPLFKIFDIFVGKHFSSCQLKFPGKIAGK